MRDVFLCLKRQLVERPDNLAVNRVEPDFFWIREATRLHAIVIRGEGSRATLVREYDGKPLKLAYDPKTLAKALRTGELYADRILTYLARCILPKIVAIGGTVQQDYVKFYCNLIDETQKQISFLDHDELNSFIGHVYSRLGGMPLLELSDDDRAFIAELGPQTPLHSFAESFLNRCVGDTVGTLSCAYYYEPALIRWEAVTR